MPNLATVLKAEVQRLARKEIRSEVSALKKSSATHRREIAQLKRENVELLKRVRFLENREKNRMEVDASEDLAKGARFSVRSLKAQRRRAGLSQADYGRLVGVSTLTINNWENGKTRPSRKMLATLVSVRGLGKRDAARRMELLGQE